MTGAIPARMRVGVLTAPGRAEVHEAPVPAPGPEQLLVRVDGCGVCGSNLPVFEGRPWFGYPLPPGSPGHEAYGRVAASGPGPPPPFAEGERVTFLCDAAFAEYAVVDATRTIRIPPALDGRPFPGEPLACAVNVFRRARIGRGDRVAVIGVGFLGAVVVRLAVAAGARVLAVARRRFALDLAARLGAKPLALCDRRALLEEVRRCTGGALCDVAVEAVGLQEPLELAAALLRTGGRLVIAGFHQDGRRSIDLCDWNWRALELVNAHERDPDILMEAMRAASAEVAGGALDLEPLLTHAFPLERLAEAFEAMRSRPEGFLKGIVTP